MLNVDYEVLITQSQESSDYRVELIYPPPLHYSQNVSAPSVECH